MAIQIYFAGLICHYSGNPKKDGDRGYKIHSILVNDSVHKPHITISGGTTIDVTSDIVFSDNANAHARTRDATFDQCVPHLADLTADDVSLKEEGNLKVILPFGEFHVADHFQYGFTYDLNGNITSRACAAHVTLLVADAEQLIVTVNGNSKSLTNANHDWVFIENASQETIKNEGDHWAKYAKLLDGSQKLALYTRGNKKHDCPGVVPGDHLGDLGKYTRDLKDEEFTAASSECTNSQWP